MHFLQSIRNQIIIGFMALIILPSFLGGICYGVKDLLRQIWNPSYNEGTVIHGGENVDTEGRYVFEGDYEIDIGTEGIGAKKAPSLIVKLTRFLLSLVIALSVTMILYNGMKYIIETGQGKEAKDLTKNIAYIVAGILISLFSAIIITLIQSIPYTLDKELYQDMDNQTDNEVLEGTKKAKSWSEIWHDITD